MGSVEEHKPYKFYNIINSEKRTASEWHQVTDPRTEQPLWDAPVATPEDLEEAIVAANKAFKTWGKTTVPERQAALRKMVDIINDNAPEIAELAMRETGKSKLMGQIEIGNTGRQILNIGLFHSNPLPFPSLPTLLLYREKAKVRLILSTLHLRY
jgi:delta 1-pyrroline-5-carboxylate dehydrogenase